MGNLPNKFGPIVPRDGDLDEWKWVKLLPPGHFFGTCIYQPFSSWWFGNVVFPYIGNVIIPTDELHHCSEG
jgi:uncharacterized membrane protein